MLVCSKSPCLKENKLNVNVSNRKMVISSMDSPSELPNHPPVLSVNLIEKMVNIRKLKVLEDLYDDFLDKNMQVLLLFNVIEDYLEIRDTLTIRIIKLKREQKLRFQFNKYILEE